MTKAVIINSRSKNSTKKEIAKELYKLHHNLARKDLIFKFVEEMHITENSARTHISWCAKELNKSLNKPYITRHIDSSKLKRERAYNLFKTNPSMDRKSMIKLFQNKLHISENSAATHCSLSAKRFTGEHNNVQHKSIA